MADFSTLIATLQATIKTNYRQEITGQILQDDLLAMVNVINQLKQDTLAGYAFHGAPLADGDSVSVTQNTFFLVGKGTYTINGISETTGEGISALVYDSVNDEVRNYPLFAYDTTPTENSRNAITSGAVAAALAPLATKEDVEAVEQEVAQVAGEAGLAEAVIDTDNAGTEQEFTFRKSGGDGGAYYRKVLGCTFSINQLAIDSPTVSGVTVTHNSDGSYTINGISNSPWSSVFFVPPTSGKVGHKIFLRLIKISGSVAPVSSVSLIDGDEAGAISLDGGANVYTKTSDNLEIGIYGSAGDVYNNYRCFVQVVDLTLAGIASEISTADDFLALYPNPLPYNPGTLISNDAEAVETTGVNQWDGQKEDGKLIVANTGDLIDDPTSFVTRHIPVIAGETYYFSSCFAVGSGIFGICFYDNEKNYISGSIVTEVFAFTRVIPSGIAFMRVTGTLAYVNTGIINLSNAAINGQYFPYWKRTLQLGITTRKDTDGNVPFADGMKGAGTASDWADKVGGEKRMKRINLGDLDWDYDSNVQLFYYNYIEDAKAPVNNSTPANMICGVYENVSDAQSASIPKAVSLGTTKQICVHDTAYSDPAAFKAAMQGVMLDYELAAPVPFTWAEPLNLGVKVDENGTERAVAPEGATAPSAPFVADTTYTMSVARMVEKLQNL